MYNNATIWPQTEQQYTDFKKAIKLRTEKRIEEHTLEDFLKFAKSYEIFAIGNEDLDWQDNVQRIKDRMERENLPLTLLES